MAEIREDKRTDEWSEIDDSLEEDTERVKEQLRVQVSAEIDYPDGRGNVWYSDLAENYEQLIDAFGGEEEVTQYLEINPQGVKVSVEQDDVELFTVYTVEPGEDLVEEPKRNYKTADYL
jgi:hypothetical protein